MISLITPYTHHKHATSHIYATLSTCMYFVHNIKTGTINKTTCKPVLLCTTLARQRVVYIYLPLHVVQGEAPSHTPRTADTHDASRGQEKSGVQLKHPEQHR